MKVLLFLALPCCIVARSYVQQCQEGQVQPCQDNNHQYNLCQGGTWLLMDCPYGLTFDSYSNECRQIDSQIGQEGDYCEPPKFCSGNSYFEDRCNCHKFYKCVDNQVHHKDCGALAFNPADGGCQFMQYSQLCKELQQV